MAEKVSQCFSLKVLTNIKLGRNAKVKLMLKKGMLKASDEKGTLMHYAAEYDNPNIIHHLIKLGLDVNCLNSAGKTPLMIAVEQGRVKAVRTLLEAKTNIDIIDPDGNTALKLFFASAYLDGRIFESFIERFDRDCITLDKTVDLLFKANCPMSYAAMMDNKIKNSMMASLLERGVEIDSTGPSKVTALQIVVRTKNLYLARWLINQGADVNAVDENNERAIHSAAKLKDVDLIGLLLENEANPNVKDADGLTPLCHMIICYTDEDEVENDDECIQLLLEHGAILQLASIDDERVFDLILNAESPRRANCLVAHVAMLEKRGHSIYEEIFRCDDEEHLDEEPRLKEYYEKCRHMLGSTVYKTVTLLDLLDEKESRMRIKVRNNSFISKIEKIHDLLEETYPLYDRLLIKKMSKAINLVKLEDAAIPVLCKFFNCSYNQFYNFAREIVSYLNRKDLEQLSQV